jgi:hypothetical protein
MCAVLLPNQAVVPPTVDSAFNEFSNLCSQYRESLWNNDIKVKMQHSFEQCGWDHQKWTERINEFLGIVRQRKIRVRPLSDLPFEREIDELRQRYPANFR